MNNPLLASVFLPAGIAAIMFALGLSLVAADFRRVWESPKAVAIGMVNLAVVAPLLAFAMAELFALPPALAVGLVLLGASPGGMMANMLTHLARGDTALSVSMTALSSMAAVLTLPIYVAASTAHFGVEVDAGLEMSGLALLVFAVTILPLAAGMALNARWPEEVAARSREVRIASLTVFVAIVAGAIVSEHRTVIEYIPQVAAAGVALNLSAMGVAFATARLAQLSDAQATAIALELGIHNAALAIAVGATMAAEFSVPAAVYSSFMLGTGGAFAYAMSRRNPVRRPAAVV